jgi:hypothetical protein
VDQQEQWNKFQERLDAIQEEQRRQEERQKTQLQRALNAKIPVERRIVKFTCDELLKIFGGWFTLQYAYSTFDNMHLTAKGEPVETIYYVASQDVYGMRVNERPGLNEAVSRLVGKDVYGFAIIAPASAFGGEKV